MGPILGKTAAVASLVFWPLRFPTLTLSPASRHNEKGSAHLSESVGCRVQKRRLLLASFQLRIERRSNREMHRRSSHRVELQGRTTPQHRETVPCQPRLHPSVRKPGPTQETLL